MNLWLPEAQYSLLERHAAQEARSVTSMARYLLTLGVELLEKSGEVGFAPRAVVHGHPDMLLRLPDGTEVVAEVKAFLNYMKVQSRPSEVAEEVTGPERGGGAALPNDTKWRGVEFRRTKTAEEVTRPKRSGRSHMWKRTSGPVTPPPDRA